MSIAYRLELFGLNDMREWIMYWKTTSDGKESPGCILAVFDGIREVKWKRGIYIGGFGDVCYDAISNTIYTTILVIQGPRMALHRKTAKPSRYPIPLVCFSSK